MLLGSAAPDGPSQTQEVPQRHRRISQVSRFDGNALIDTLIAPSAPIPPETTRVHGIVDADVIGAEHFLVLSQSQAIEPCGNIHLPASPSMRLKSVAKQLT